MLSENRHRIKIEHIHSGERTQVATFAAAVDWIEARSGGAEEVAPQTGEEE